MTPRTPADQTPGASRRSPGFVQGLLGESIRRRRPKQRPPLRRLVANRRFLQALAATGGGLGVGYLVAVLLLFPVSRAPLEVRMTPELRGQPVNAALAVLADSGFTISRIDSIHHPEAAAGMVIGQSPLPGPTSLAGSPVRVTVSLGADVRPVPDLTRVAADRAAEFLVHGGFAVTIDTIDATAPAGRVLALEPPPGTEVELPAQVLLTVSRGPPTLAMPDLAGLTVGEANALLRAARLALGEIDRRYSILNVNRVFGQDPEPSDTVTQGTAVRIVVGREMRLRGERR